ncbi:hypothetical protein [Pedobacter cryoconitis]|uniref:Uncharacterized protein n=1 Tax=Pedobacter cryoconitis TaxID=188932 RepID=A0A327SIS0_9SPHI|nr:hypothetical protein [Pedobacter cryoconitis]RAJ28889.1 hypothetical protein LY11_03163 [Pedobacter cryoconitis]
MKQEDINKLKNKISSLERQVEIQKGRISFLESQSGKIVDGADISHESLKCLAKRLSPDVAFKYAIDWYREQLTEKS